MNTEREALAEQMYFNNKAAEFLDDLVPQLTTAQLEFVHAQIETELRERDESRNKAYGCPF